MAKENARCAVGKTLVVGIKGAALVLGVEIDVKKWVCCCGRGKEVGLLLWKRQQGQAH